MLRTKIPSGKSRIKIPASTLNGDVEIIHTRIKQNKKRKKEEPIINGSRDTKDIIAVDAKKRNTKSVAGNKAINSSKKEGKKVYKNKSTSEKMTHGEDLYLIPVQGEIHPVRTKEAHKVENIFHQREEVALHQENQKVKLAMSSRKSSKRIYHHPGQR